MGLGLVILVLASISVVVSARGIGGSDAERDSAYVEEISKNYDFKFGRLTVMPFASLSISHWQTCSCENIRR